LVPANKDLTEKIGKLHTSIDYSVNYMNQVISVLTEEKNKRDSTITEFCKEKEDCPPKSAKDMQAKL